MQAVGCEKPVSSKSSRCASAPLAHAAEIALVRELDECLYLLVRIRQENRVGRPFHHAVANAEEVRETLAITVEEPLKRVERDLFGL